MFALVWILLSFLAFAISSQIQKGKLATWATRSTATRSCSSARRRSSCSAPTSAPAQFAGPDEAASKNCLDAVGERQGAAPQLQTPYRSDTIMLIRAGRRRLPQAVDPARHPRRHPRARARRRSTRPTPSAARKLTVRTVEKFLGHRRRPGGDHRLRRLPQVHRHDRRASRSTCRPTSARPSRTAPSTSSSRRASTHLERLPGDHPRAHPLRTPAAHGEFTGDRHRARASSSS